MPVFVAKRIFKTYQGFCFLCFILVDAFSGSIKAEITKNLFTLAESNFGEKKTFVHSLELWLNFICGNETGSPGRAVSLHLARSGSQSEHRIRSILPARGACHIISLLSDHVLTEHLNLFVSLLRIQCLISFGLC